jgi:ATP-dependent helicase HrpA
VAEAEARKAARVAAVPAVTYPPDLPVTGRREDILSAIRDHQVVVVSGETGSGKTTQIPKMCVELGRGVDGMIGHTQPRRIAARTVAERISDELSVPLGGAVGYAVRFTDTVSDTTLLKVMTDGILLAEIRSDRLLSAYDTIIVDEAHERTLNIDFLLGFLTRLLPRRPDLKLIVTSATIDTERFAAHFAAPVVRVSGRTFPVEVRYRPLDPATGPADEDSPAGSGSREGAGGGLGAARSIGSASNGVGSPGGRDLNQAICDAVNELVCEGPGDVLVFLPGERDIRDAAEALREAGPPDAEILPLYARLTAAEQHRVFKAHAGRRVVLATNVAETSLTVPGIRYVVDTGLARISRYSHRTKVQRLPIEAVSRASADQRAGRCGRLAPGVCIRLYPEEDYLGRPEFTDPEILRTNLASVILQMAAIGLGEVEDFPFIEAPDRRSIADGRALLEELGAFGQRGGAERLTPTGRRLARMPLDPRLARMVLESDRKGCLREVTIIAAALAIQDPRERPRDDAEAASEMHARFEAGDSDFMAYLRLWDHLADLQKGLSGNQFRRRCRSEFLNVLRVREWQDVAGQIREVTRSEGMHANSDASDSVEIHRSVLAGLLSHVGMRDPLRGDYQGARNSRWQIGRDSSLARRRPAWAMAASLVETERTWARTVARIDPGWAEDAGSHLVKASHSDPWWDPERAEALTDERVTLYGLPVVAGRRIGLARVDPGEARSIFIEKALVEGDRKGGTPGIEPTRELVSRIEELGRRARRADLLAGDEPLRAFYETRIPAGIANGRGFDRWWSRARRSQPDLLEVPPSVLLNPDAPALDPSSYPDLWRQGEIELQLHYSYEPGAPGDGVTVEVPLGALNRVTATDFQWQVPGLREELVTALVRALPRALRRSLPTPVEAARAVLAVTGPSDGPLLPAVAAALARISGEPLDAGVWGAGALPGHLVMKFEVVDDDGGVLATGRDLEELRRRMAPELRAALARMATGIERSGALVWDFGDLPRQVDRGLLRGYPALVDEGSAVGVTLFESNRVQAESMWQGTRRLLLLGAPIPAGHIDRRLTRDTRQAIAASGVPLADLLEDCATAEADRIIVSHGGPAFEQAGFESMVAEARSELTDRVTTLAIIAGGVLAAGEQVLHSADRLEARAGSGQWVPAIEDVRRQVGRLVGSGFVASAGPERLADLLRYLQAAEHRLDRLPRDVRRDGLRQATVDRLQSRYESLLDDLLAGTLSPGSRAGLSDVRWMIEELRVSLWAQSLGTKGPVSEERVQRALDRLAA